MDEYRIAICDDESMDRARLRDLIKKHPFCPENLIIYEYEAGEELLEDYREFDAVFVDIGMKIMNGKDTARAVRQIDAAVILAFYTGIEEYASRIVPVHPFIYLRKNDTEEVITDVHELEHSLRTIRQLWKDDRTGAAGRHPGEPGTLLSEKALPVGSDCQCHINGDREDMPGKVTAL